MSNADKNVDFPAIQADQMKTVVGFVGEKAHKRIRAAEENVLKAMVVMRGEYFGKVATTPELEETETYKRLFEVSKALSELSELTEPVITSRL